MEGLSANAAGIRARATATRRLIEQHPHEFEEFHGDEREALGLPRTTSSSMTPREKLEARIAKMTAQLAEMD